MIKHFTFLFTILPMLGFSQITLNSSDFASVGDQIFMGRDTIVPAGTVVGSAGANLSWDFSGFQTDRLDTLKFIDPATLPQTATFPDANISFKQFGANAFGKKTATEVEILGIAGTFGNTGVNMVAEFNPTQKAMEFPTVFQSAFKDTSQFEVWLDVSASSSGQADSARIKRRTISDNVVDAWGTVKTPLVEVPSLRQKSITNTLDSIWIKSGPNPFFNPNGGWILLPQFLASLVGVSGPVVNTTTIYYRWYSQNSKYILVEIAMDQTGNTPQRAIFQSDPSACCTGIDDATANGGFRIFPNPATSEINIRMGAALNETVKLNFFDVSGRKVKTVSVDASTSNINIAELSNGIYIYTINDSNDHLIQKGKLSILN